MSPDTTLAGAAVPTETSPPSAAPVANTVAPLAALPALAPRIPVAGQKSTVAPLAGSADALALAQVALQATTARRTLSIVCADALATQRLADEMTWLAPGLRIAIFPDWETLPYDHFSPHQDLVS